MQMNSLESGLQKREDCFSFFFPFLLPSPFRFCLPATSLHLPSTPQGPWAQSWFEKVWISSWRQSGGERGARGSGAGKRWLSDPSPASADAKVFGEPRLVPREPRASRDWESGRAAGRGAVEEGGRGSLACPFGGRGPERRAGDAAAADLPGAQCPFGYGHIPIINCLQHVLCSPWNKKA